MTTDFEGEALSSELSRSTTTPIGKIVLGLTALTVALWASTDFVVPYLSRDASESGSYGDMYGWITSLFTGLAFSALIGTLLLQSKAVSLQRQDLKATLEELGLMRDEMAKSREQAKRQSETLAKQNFETTFFALIRLHQNTLVNMEHGAKSGRYAVQALWDSYRSSYDQKRNQQNNEALSIDDLKDVFHGFYRSNEFSLGPYFANIFTIATFIDVSPVVDKHFYMGIFMSQLSQAEKCLLFYFGLSSVDPGMKPILERHHLLTGIYADWLLDREEVCHYDPLAFRRVE